MNLEMKLIGHGLNMTLRKKDGQKGKKISVLEDVEKMEHLSIVHGNVESCSFYDKQNGSSSKLKNRTTM